MKKLQTVLPVFLQNKDWKNNPVILNWLIIMTTVSLVFPDYSLFSKLMILLAGYWLFFYQSFQEKITLLKQNFWPFLSVSFLFWLPFAGLIYSDNLNDALNDLILKLPFLFLPIIIFSGSKIVNFKTVFKYYSYTVVLISLSAIFQAVVLKYGFETNYLYYHEFSFFTNKHTTYFGLILTLALLYFLIEVIKNKNLNIQNILIIVFLLFTLYINANRMSLLVVIIDLLILLYFYCLHKHKFLSLLIFALILGGLTQTVFFQNRILPVFTKKNNDLRLRIRNVKMVVEAIQNRNILIGRGTESSRDDLYDLYKKAGAKIAYQEKYNAHNQFLETTLDFGLLGFLILLGFISYHFYIFTKYKQVVFLIIYFSILSFMLTESILERQIGIVIYSIFVSFMLMESLKKSFKKKKIAY